MHLIKKIIYCKCPNCNKHGIIIWSKLKNKGDLTMVCKECGKAVPNNREQPHTH